MRKEELLASLQAYMGRVNAMPGGEVNVPSSVMDFLSAGPEAPAP
jgi:hypothetical protein